MLDDIKYKQPLFYNVLSSSLKNNMLSHAYLIDINNNENAFCYILSFVKAIICNNHYTNGNKCDGCDICNRIMDNNYPEFKIIKPDGLWIKRMIFVHCKEIFLRRQLRVLREYMLY